MTELGRVSIIGYGLTKHKYCGVWTKQSEEHGSQWDVNPTHNSTHHYTADDETHLHEIDPHYWHTKETLYHISESERGLECIYEP